MGVFNCLFNSTDMQSVIFFTVFILQAVNSIPIDDTSGRPKPDGHRTKLPVDHSVKSEKTLEKHVAKVEIKKHNLKQEISQGISDPHSIKSVDEKLSQAEKIASLRKHLCRLSYAKDAEALEKCVLKIEEKFLDKKAKIK